MTVIVSAIDGSGEREEAERIDASSAGVIAVVNWGMAEVEVGAKVSVEESGKVTAADAVTPVVVDGESVVVVLAVEIVVVGIAVVVAGLAAVVVRLAVVAVGLPVVVVRSISSSSWSTVVVVRLAVVAVVTGVAVVVVPTWQLPPGCRAMPPG
jgi:hypothetical protein